MVILNILGKIEKTYVSNKLGLYISNLPDGGENNWNNWQEWIKETLRIAYETEKLEASRYIGMEQMKKDNELYEKIVEEYTESYTWENADYSVIVPKDLFSIKEEGAALNHCVGSYTHKVAEQKTIILFIRKNSKPEKSFFTMEVKEGKIVQCRGVGNCDMPEDVRCFIHEYEKSVLLPAGMKMAV